MENQDKPVKSVKIVVRKDKVKKIKTKKAVVELVEVPEEEIIAEEEKEEAKEEAKPIIPLNIVKRQSNLDGITLLEIIPKNSLKAIIKSDFLLLNWSEDYQYDIHKKQIAENYSNEKTQLIAYKKNYKDALGGVPVPYKKPKHKWGRAFPLYSLGLSCLRRIIRNSLISDNHYDFDLKNAQPEIIRLLCESNNISCPKIQRYCKEREDRLLEVQNHYKVVRDVAKDLFIRLCFFGSFLGWCLENKIQDRKPLEFVTDFEAEIKSIAEKVKKENKELYETARKKKEDNGEAKENKILGSFFALYNQEYESRIVESVLCYIINHTDLMKIAGTKMSAGAYEYDGIKLLKKNVDAFEGGVNAVVKLLNEKTFELTEFRLEWANKPFEEKYDLTKYIEELSNDNTPNIELNKDLDIINSALDNSDAGVIETIMMIKPSHYIYSVDKKNGSKGDWYGWNDVRWEKSDAPLKKAIIYDVPNYWRGLIMKYYEIYGNMVIDKDDEPDKDYLRWKDTSERIEGRIKDLKSNNGVNNCVGIAKTLMANYLLEFDTNVDLFGCENCVIDIANECVRPYKFDDYVTLSCGYAFTPQIIGFKVIDKLAITRKITEKDIYDKKFWIDIVGRKIIDKEGKCRDIFTQKALDDLNNGLENNEKCLSKDLIGCNLIIEDEISHKVTEKDVTEDFKTSHKLIMDTYKQIFPDEELRNYVFKIISTGVSGRAIAKFFVFNGKGRNGKGLTNEFLEKVFGDYFTNVSPIVFSENQKTKSSSGANPELFKLNKKRWVVAKEPQKDAPLHNSIIKDLTGGGNVSARECYSNEAVVLLCMTLCMECNVKPPLSEPPEVADTHRIDDILFGSSFISNKDEWDINTGVINHIYPLDAELKEIFKNSPVHKNTFLNICVENVLLVKAQKYNIDFFRPESVLLRSASYLQKSYDIHNIFQLLFEKRIEANASKYLNWKGELKDADWTLTKIASKIKSSKDYCDLSKTKQKEYNAEYIVNFFKTNKIYSKDCINNTDKHAWEIKGYRLKLEELDEDEDD